MTTTDHRRAEHAALTTVIIAGVATTSGCGVASSIGSVITHVESRHFETYDAAPTRGNLAFVLPHQVPHDATDVSITVATDNASVKAYAWTSATEPGKDCTAAPEGAKPAPENPKGFPDDLKTVNAVVCDGLVEVRDSQRTYAWISPDTGTSG